MHFKTLLLALVTLFTLTANAKSPAPTVTNNYGSKWVYETKGMRCISFRPPPTRVVQSCMVLKQPEKLLFNYTKMFFSSFYIIPEPKKILLIGLGGASVPKALVKILPNVKIDVVEIDPDIVALAEKHFLFKTSDNVSAFTEDGFEFVRKSPSNQYDIIMIDAFTEDYVPPNFLTKEFVDNVRRILTDKGAVAINTFGKGSNKFYQLESELCTKNFENVIDLNEGNRVILASKVTLPSVGEINKQALKWEADFASIGINKEWLLKKLGIIDPKVFWLLKSSPKENK